MKRKELLKSKEFWIVKIQNQLYEELEKYLRENNVSKTELANKMGVSKGYISQILNGDFDHKLSKLIEIIMVMDKVPILNLENIDDCINIDKEIGIDKLNERFTFNITINYNNVFELEKETSKRNFEFLEQQNLFNFGNLKKANLKPVEYTLLN
jgi:transcriptional regulator with XRE-family HTH domain